MVAMEVSPAVSAGEPVSPPPLLDDSCDMFENDELKEICSSGTLDFDDWTWLISEIENSFPDDIEKLCLVYDAFLSEFPLCHGYWKKYAYQNIRLGTVEKAVEVFERAVQVATYSVAVWVDYCTFAIAAYEDPDDVCRLFERGLSFVGKDYLCYALWDKYIEFLSVQQQWSSLAHIYLRMLKYPSKKLHLYYESFRKLVVGLKEEIECRIDVNGDLGSEPIVEDVVPASYSDDEIASVVRDLFRTSTGLALSKALQAFLSIGEQFYQDAQQLMEKLSCFETHIRRSYFHVKPLDTNQLDNWHEYLDFAETHGNLDWAIKLYERCLIPCANYPEFWIRYVDFVESKGGREIANFALARATQTFVKNASVIHLFDTRFKECVGNTSAAYAALFRCAKEPGFGFIENVIKKANMEKRLGDFEAADHTYREALEKISAGKENLESLPLLYVHFSRLKYMLTKSADAAEKILMEGIEKVPHCKLLLQELIRFMMMHGGSRQVDLVDSIVDKEISHQSGSLDGLSAQDKEDISNLYMEFIDLCGTIHDVRKAWKRHIKLFPHSVCLKAYACPVVREKPFKEILQRRRKTLVHSIQNLSTDNGIDKPVISSAKEKKELPPDSDGVQSGYTATDHVNFAVQSDHLNIHPNLEALDDLKQLSLERLPLGSKEDEDERHHDGSLPNQALPKDNFATKRAHFLTNPTGARESDAIEIQPSGTQSPTNQGYIPGEALQEQESVGHSGRSRNRRSDANQNHRDSKPGSHETPPQRKFQKYSPVETTLGVLGQLPGVLPQKPTFAAYTDQAAPQSSVSQNPQNQDPVSASQPQIPAQTALAYPQAQIPRNTVQSNEQQGLMQSNDAYNEMWQQYYYYYYYYQQQQQLLNQQPQPNQNSQQQPDQNPLQLIPEQYQQQLLQSNQFLQSQQLQQSQAEPQHPPPQQLEQHNMLQSPIQQSQEQHHIQLEQQQQWFLQQQRQQQQQWFLQQQQQPQQQQYPQQQSSYDQQQQYHLYLQYHQQQQQQQAVPQPQPQGAERHDEQKLSEPQIPSRDGQGREGQEHGAATAAACGDMTG